MSKRLAYIHQLDALRTLAVLLVLCCHYLPFYNLASFSFGQYGVQIFFCISGFLISLILIQQKETQQSKSLLIKNFFIKRILRLFPLYYIILITFSLLRYKGLLVWLEGDGIYYYTYTSNILFFLEGEKGPQLNHLWSLAVEEQFYLIWPFIIFFISNKILPYLLLILIALSIGIKTYWWKIMGIEFLTLCHFDTLSFGALLAYLIKFKKIDKNKAISKLITAPFFLIILVIIALLSTTYLPKGNPLPYLSILALSGALVYGCFVNYKGWLGRLFDWKFFIYLGKISYGIYLFHKPIPYFIRILLDNLALDVNPLLLFSLSLGLTLLLAHLSYQFMESKFIQLKARFDS